MLISTKKIKEWYLGKVGLESSYVDFEECILYFKKFTDFDLVFIPMLSTFCLYHKAIAVRKDTRYEKINITKNNFNLIFNYFDNIAADNVIDEVQINKKISDFFNPQEKK